MNAQNPNPNAMLRSKYQNQWKGASGTLFGATILSIVNIVLYALGSDTYFLLRIYFPYSMGVAAINYLIGANHFEKLPILGLLFLSMAMMVFIIYLICYYLSRKKAGWLIAGVVLFSFDTAFMLCVMIIVEDPVAFLSDIIFHIVALVELGIGVAAASKLKKLPADEIVVPAVEVPSEAASDSTANVFDEIPKQANDQPGISDEFKK